MNVVWKAVLGLLALLLFVIVSGLMLATPETDAAHDAKRAVEAQMRDGSSAEFRTVKVYRPNPDIIAVCGEVNGTNAFGAKVGFERFFVLAGGTPVIEDPTNSSSFETVWVANRKQPSDESPTGNQGRYL